MRTGEKIQLAGYEDLFADSAMESTGATEINIADITAFEGHPFKVIDDEQMDALVQSVRENGILSPILVRPLKGGKYETISGHRRTHAAIRAGLTVVPAIVKELSDDEAVILMVDSNIQREELLPSERAFALKMKLDAMRHQGIATDGKWSSDAVGEADGLGGRQVLRYVRLTKLLPGLLDLVDAKRLSVKFGTAIAGFSENAQSYILRHLQKGGKISAHQICLIRALDEEGEILPEQIDETLQEKKSVPLSLPEKKVREFFPENYSAAEIEIVVFKLLKEWSEGRADK